MASICESRPDQHSSLKGSVGVHRPHKSLSSICLPCSDRYNSLQESTSMHGTCQSMDIASAYLILINKEVAAVYELNLAV